MQKNKLEIIHNLTKKHWIIYTLLTFIPTIWFPFILNYLGITFKLIKVINNEKKFTLFGAVVTALIVISVIIINLFNNFYSSRTELGKLAQLEGVNTLYETVLISTDHICNEKLEQLKMIIPKVLNESAPIPQIITNPKNQLKKILEQIQNSLIVMMDQVNEKYSLKDYNVSLAYNFPQHDDKWYWVEGISENEYQPDFLIKSKSTLSFLMDSNKPYYFNNQKEEAKKLERYIYNSEDEANCDSGNIVGSIFCYKICVKKNNTTYINSVLSITTKQKRIVQKEEKVNKAGNSLFRIMQDNFSKRISIELSLLYLEKLSQIKLQEP